MVHAYTQPRDEKTARAVGVNLDVSFKQSIEICNNIRGKTITRAKALLEDVITMVRPMKFTRFVNGLGHKRGHMGPARYPQKASKAILNIINSAQANAQHKGLSTTDLVLSQACAQKGSNQYKAGRHRGRQAKRTHIEIILAEEQKQENKKQ